MTKGLLIIFILSSLISQAQTYVLANEELVFSFDTKNGKHVVLARDKKNLYFVYRFGSTDKIEFEFPGKTAGSWSKFKYSFYLRGGGVQNEGMDLNNIYFSSGDYKYIVYDNYIANGNEKSLGIKITNLKTNKTTDINGRPETRKGSLVDFRNNNLLEISDESEGG
jgi:hypothetical protein